MARGGTRALGNLAPARGSGCRGGIASNYVRFLDEQTSTRTAETIVRPRSDRRCIEGFHDRIGATDGVTITKHSPGNRDVR
eukprot:scaffold867_cov317-Pavlova_lutheri.AAC.5